MQNIQDNYKRDLVIGIDAQAITALDLYPPMLFHYHHRHLSALIKEARNSSFIFFAQNETAYALIQHLFPFPNISVALVGCESRSSLDLYYMPDQTSILPVRPPPLLIAPRNVPISILLHNMLVASAPDIYLRRWPEEVVRFHLHAIEMITASPARVLCSSQYEASLVEAIAHVPSRQISSIGGAASIPLSFALSKQRWEKLRDRLSLPETFIVVPSDTLSPEGEQEMLEILQSVKKFNSQICLVRPALRRFLAALLPDPQSNREIPASVIYEPELSYEEFLEVVARCKGYFLPGEVCTIAGAYEAKFFGVPVFCTRPILDFGILAQSAADIVTSISDRTVNITANDSADDIWRTVAQKTLACWTFRNY